MRRLIYTLIAWGLLVVPAWADNARNFAGGNTTDYMSLAGNAIWNYNTNVCVLAQFKADTLTTNHVMAAVGAAGSRGWNFDILTTGALRVNKIGGGNDTASSFTLSTGVWYTALWCGTTGGAATYKLYNHSTGALSSETQASAVAMTAPSTDPLTIANWITRSNNDAFDGLIQRVAIMQGVPTDAEVRAYACRATLPGSVTMKGAWDFRGLSPETDLSGNGNSLTANGTTSVTGFTPCRATSQAVMFP